MSSEESLYIESITTSKDFDNFLPYFSDIASILARSDSGIQAVISRPFLPVNSSTAAFNGGALFRSN